MTSNPKAVAALAALLAIAVAMAVWIDTSHVPGGPPTNDSLTTPVQPANGAGQGEPREASTGTPAVAIEPGPGVRQRFVIAPPVLDPLPLGVNLHVFGGGEELPPLWVPLTRGEAADDETHFAPGSYRVEARDGERLLATATFTVGEREGAPVRLELR